MRSYDASFVQIAPDFPRSRALPPSLPYGQGWVSVSALSRTFEASQLQNIDKNVFKITKKGFLISICIAHKH
jgi:hypothetical protein